MIDNRVRKYFHTLLTYSLDLKKGDNLLVQLIDIPPDVASLLVDMASDIGVSCFIDFLSSKVNRSLLKACTTEGLKIQSNLEVTRMKEMDAYLSLYGDHNNFELSDIPTENIKLHDTYIWTPVHERIRVPHKKWVIAMYPNASMAQLAKMSTSSFEDFLFKVCSLDYAKMDLAMDNLVDLMSRTDEVHIVGYGTDLIFSIKDMGAMKCSGKYNLPDGEVYSSPVIDSVNGVLHYNTDSIYQGTLFSNVSLQFFDGQIISANCQGDLKKLNEIFDTDEGARYIGEFALGVNPYITKPMGDILFDEKIVGSFHFTPGSAYEDVGNGNKSQIHWDLVCIQTSEYQGGNIYFDGVLVRKDGLFVLPELEALNPENLK